MANGARVEQGTMMKRQGIALSAIKLSVVVTVFSETFSIDETIRSCSWPLTVGTSWKFSSWCLHALPQETFSICRHWEAQEPRVKVLVQKNNPGIGWAYREGMEAAKGNYVALMAADLETEPAAVDRMVQKVEETGCDEVIANRWLPGGGFTNYDPLKLVLNWIFQKGFRVLFWYPHWRLHLRIEAAQQESGRRHRVGRHHA